MKLKLFLLWLSLVWVCQSSFSQEASRAQEIEKIEAGLKWTTGRVVLGNNLAEVNLASSYRYLGPEDARKVIVDLWGNPPSRGDTLGMIFPADVAAKAGLFKGLIALILAGKKFIILAAIAAGGFFVKLYRKFKKPKPESLTDTAPSDPFLRRPPSQD